MKEVIMNMRDISYSSEVYSRRPHPFFKIFVYIVLGLVLSFVCFANIFKVENTVKLNGIITNTNDITSITNKVDGKISKIYVKDNQFVNKGDKLYEIDNKDAKDSFETIKNQKKELEDRISIINAYIEALKDNTNELIKLKSNQFYDEYLNKLELIETTNKDSIDENNKKNNSYLSNINNNQSSINTNNNKINKLNILIDSITNLINKFNSDDIYYYNKVENYILNYNKTSDEYDNKINELINSGASQESINALKKEKQNVLSSIKSEELSNVQKEKDALNEENAHYKNSIDEASAGISSSNTTAKITKLQEISNQHETLQGLKDNYNEVKNNYKTIKRNYNACNVKASRDGYIDLKTELITGNILQSGTNVINIIPKDKNYKIKIMITNYDIGKINTGMSAKCKFASFPEDKYGYLEGKVSLVSKNIKLYNKEGYYYMGEIIIKKSSLNDSKGNIVRLKEGMSSEVRVVVEKISLMRFLLRKINLCN